MSRDLGEILIEHGVLSPEQLAQAEQRRQQSGEALGKVLIELGWVQEADLVRALAVKISMPYVDVDGTAVDRTAAQMVSRSLATELVALPVGFGEGDELVVAVADPSNTTAKEKIEAETGLTVRLALTARRALLQAIAHLTDDGGVRGDGAPTVAAGRPTLDDLGLDMRTSLVQAEEDSAIDLDQLLIQLVEMKGSDLHLTAGRPPTVRLHGDLMALEGYPVMVPEELRKIVYGILTQKQRETFENQLELDVSYAVPGRSRFRVNVFQQRDSVGAVMRVIPFEIKPLADLGVPEQVANFAFLPRGFVLVTGPTGSGKSTTLASLIDLANSERQQHIMTVEDPIEFLHRHKRCVVNQREVGTDTHSFTEALKHVLRQDPDIILVGEMRDLETISIALTAAETGHLVFATLHTQDAPQTVDRVIDVFPPHQQEQIRVQLAGALQGVVSQQLLKTSDGVGRVVSCEVMIATPAIRNLIREGKTHQIYSAIQAGGSHGMVAMDQTLAQLVLKGTVTYDEAVQRCSNVQEFNRLAGRG